MSSPFSTFKEFSEAKGPIYTFANNPTAIGILLAICFAISVYFFYASFAMKQEDFKSKNPIVPSILILASAVSFASSLFNIHPSKQSTVAYRRSSQSEIAAPWKKLQPLTLLGVMGIGSAALGQKARRRSPRQLRRSTAYRSTPSIRP